MRLTTLLRPTSRSVQVLVAIAFVLPYFINLGTSSLWDANESFYAETPREMLETGDYLAPKFNYQPRPQKPPLVYWLILLSYEFLGISEFAVRLPGALAAVGVLLFTYGIGRTLFCRRAGILAVVILATCARFFILARKLPIDIVLLFWLTGIAYFLVRILRQRQPSQRNWLFVYFFAAMGFLTKGPIALILPAAIYSLWGIWARKFSVRAMHPLAGVFVFAAVVLPWYILIYWAHGWNYIASFFLKDNLGRFASVSFGPARGPFYYLTAYLFDFFPWSILTAIAGYYLWLQRKQLRELSSLHYGFPLFWCGVVFIFFSLSKNKQEYYIAPLYPLMAVLLGGVLEQTLLAQQPPEQKRLSSYWHWGFFTIALLFFGLSMFLLIVLRSMLPDLPGVFHYLPSAICMATSLILAWQLIQGKLSRCITILALPVWVVFLLATALYLPWMEAYRPVKEMCKLIDEQLQPGDEAGYYVVAVPSMVYYLRRPVFEEFDPDIMVQRFQSPRSVFCIITENDYSYFVGKRDLILYVLDRRPRLITQVGLLLDEEKWAGNELLLVSNRPLPEKGAREGRENP